MSRYSISYGCCSSYILASLALMAPHEVYPNAPVVIVAVELRHPQAVPLTPEEEGELRELLADTFPISQPLTEKTFTQTGGGTPTFDERVLPRYTTRDQMTATTFKDQSITLETTSHQHFVHLESLLRKILSARHGVNPLTGLTRAGLRYIDEIRVPDISADAPAWSEWVDESLVGPTQIAADLGLRMEQAQGLAAFDRGSERKLVVRFGAAEGFALPPGGLLRRPTPPPGPFFLADIDSFWMPTAEIPPFDIDRAIEIVKDLHEPVSALFERMITNRLREEVLRNA